MNIITKKCTKCGKIKDINSFHINNRSKDGRVVHCKECKKLYYDANKDVFLSKAREYGKEYRKTHKDELAKYRKEYYLNHVDRVIKSIVKWRYKNPEKPLEYHRNRRAAKLNSKGKITTKEWVSLCEFFGNRCLCCGRTDVKLTQDHVIPLTLGGENTIFNIQPLCKSCNSKKHTNIIDYR